GPLEALETAGEHAIEEVISQAKAADVETIEGSVARGIPAQAILDYIDQYDIDLVVMGTHGRSGLDRMLLGSVTEKVLRQAAIPVLAVPGPDVHTDNED
ncbi:MAG: universal stress protein, partial [Salinirussus sp.]